LSANQETLIYPTPFPVAREDECNHTSFANGTAILPVTSNMSKADPGSKSAELSGRGPAVSPSSGGPSVVGAPSLLMEWEKPYYPGGLYDNNIRCLPTRLGSNLQWQQEQRSMVTNREMSSHQFPGATCNHTSNSNICKREDRYLNPPSIRQLHSSCLYQQKGGTASPKLSQLTKDLWLWCMERNILIQAQHFPGVLNTITDEESRTWSDRSEWKLSPAVLQKFNRLLRPLSTDLYVSRVSTQLPVFVSWRPNPLAVATDAFTQDWNNLPGKLYANPPWSLIGRVLSQAHLQGILELILITPVWKAQAWYLTLLQMLVRVPILLPQSPDTMQPVCQNNLQLAVWVISTNNMKVATFLRQLQTSSSLFMKEKIHEII